MKIINVVRKTDGTKYQVIVDDEDYDELVKYKWFISKRNYVLRNETVKSSERGKHDKRQRTVSMHRQIMKNPKGLVIDHINRNPLDNRKENLRIVTHKKNLENQNNHSNNTSGYRGVHKLKDKWVASIRHNKKQLHIGVFDTKEEAYQARLKIENDFDWADKIVRKIVDHQDNQCSNDLADLLMTYAGRIGAIR